MDTSFYIPRASEQSVEANPHTKKHKSTLPENATILVDSYHFHARIASTQPVGLIFLAPFLPDTGLAFEHFQMRGRDGAGPSFAKTTARERLEHLHRMPEQPKSPQPSALRAGPPSKIVISNLAISPKSVTVSTI